MLSDERRWIVLNVFFCVEFNEIATVSRQSLMKMEIMKWLIWIKWLHPRKKRRRTVTQDIAELSRQMNIFDSISPMDFSFILRLYKKRIQMQNLYQTHSTLYTKLWNGIRIRFAAKSVSLQFLDGDDDRFSIYLMFYSTGWFADLFVFFERFHVLSFWSIYTYVKKNDLCSDLVA